MDEFEQIIATNWTQREADDATIRETTAYVRTFAEAIVIWAHFTC